MTNNWTSPTLGAESDGLKEKVGAAKALVDEMAIDWEALGVELVATVVADLVAVGAGRVAWNRAVRHLVGSDHELTYTEAWLIGMAIRLGAWEWEGSAEDRRREKRKQRKRIRDAIKPKD